MAIRRLNKLEIGVAAIVSLQVATLLVFFFVAFFYLNPAVEFLNVPLPTSKSVYAPGETVRVFVEVCRYTDVPSFSYTELHDNSLVPPYVKPLGAESRPGGNPGCYNIWTSAGIIPLDYPMTNHAVLHGKAVIEINSFITRVTPWQTEPFAIQSP